MTNSKAEPTILHLIDTTGPGGAETVFVQLADHIRQEGFRSVAVIRGPGWVANELKRRGLTPILIEAKGSFAVGFLFKLFKLAKSERVDIIQSHLLGSNVYAAMLGILLRKPVIATYHGLVDVNPNERFKRLKQAVMRSGIRRYVAVSKSLAEQIRRLGLLDRNKTTVVYNGIDPENYRGCKPVNLREMLRLTDDACIIGSLGNIRPAKAYDVLIDVAADIVRQNPNIHFVIAGHKKSTLMHALVSKMEMLGVTENIHFVGFLENTPGYLAQVDMFLLCSNSEGFSIATIEAMMAGKPVVATRCGGPEEIITHGETGWMAEPGNTSEIKERILFILSNPALAASVAEAGKIHAENFFGLKVMLDGYKSIYNDCIDTLVG